MKIKIIINSIESAPEQQGYWQHSTEVWSGEMDILEEGTYLTKISLIAEGQPQPICDIPFSLNSGYYMWVPPETAYEDEDPGDTVQPPLSTEMFIGNTVKRSIFRKLTRRLRMATWVYTCVNCRVGSHAICTGTPKYPCDCAKNGHKDK